MAGTFFACGIAQVNLSLMLCNVADVSTLRRLWSINRAMVIESTQHSDIQAFVAQLFAAVFNLKTQDAQRMALAARTNITELLAASESEMPSRSLTLMVIIDSVRSDNNPLREAPPVT